MIIVIINHNRNVEEMHGFITIFYFVLCFLILCELICVVKHKFAEHSLRYCLIKQLNREKCSILITSKVHTHSFQGYKRYLNPIQPGVIWTVNYLGGSM